MESKAPEPKQQIVSGAGSIPAGACLRLAAIVTAASVSLILTACNEDKVNDDGSLSSSTGSTTSTVFGTLRPKAAPETLAKIRAEEVEAQRRQAEAIAAQAQQQQQANAAVDPANRDLPAVDTSPIANLASALGFSNGNQQQQASDGSPPQPASTPSMTPSFTTAPPPPSAASYGGGGYPAFGGGPGLIPPPPAVTLSTQAAYQPPIDPNYAAYMQGGYGAYPPPQYPPPYQQPQAPAGPAHPAGSMFSNGNSGGSSSTAAAEEPKKQKAVVLITPTGMEPRSAYKQRDELKVLIKAAFQNAPMPELRDPKVATVLSRADVGLPAEATRGNISLTQRQIDNLFKVPPVDKRAIPGIKKVETDVAQAYYRYLYAFNKYTLTQQQVAARKQEMEVADTNAERQRAAADLSAAQNDADSSKEDLRAAQSDLAAVAGATAARSVIAKVSGVTPSLESLQVAQEQEESAPAGGLLGSMQNAFGALNIFGRGKEKAPEEKTVASEPIKEAPQKQPKSKDNKKKGKDAARSQQIASAPSQSESSSGASEEKERPAPVASSGISFELKNVQTTPRKSVLKVAVRNNRGESFNLQPDVITVLEGDRRLAEEQVSTEFDTTLVGPNQEVTGTITIFGRPWSDKLNVCLSEGGRTIQLHR